jgi:radical SAM superfamily enzyme YgiQ (UPF0313 family)
MNFLIVYPKHPFRIWNYERVLKYFSGMTSFPPLTLLKISSMLPRQWNKKLIDMNANDLIDEDILWADFVFISAKLNQAKSANKIIDRCKKLNAKIVASGSLFTSNDEYYKNVDDLVFDEAEITLPQFLNDLSEGKAKQKYISNNYSNITPAY